MKSFLVDVPVRINIWIRPECQRRQFEVIKKAKPSILFLVSDGGRTEEEKAVIKKNREIFENEIDWECTIYKLYEQNNQGMYTMSQKCRKYIWDRVDRCIFLEDDILPSVSFFQYCAELLEYYKDDLRVHIICGMNHLGVSQNVNSDYFFSRQGSIWGTATWRRSDKLYGDFDYAKDTYIMELLREKTSNNRIFWKRVKAYSTQKYYEGHVAGGEFFFEFGVYAQNQLQIIPKKNLISNIGCTENSAHADDINQLPKGIRKVFNMKTYEIDFPLKHAKYIIADKMYEKERNKIMAYNTPLINFYRKVEQLFLKIKTGNFKYILNKLIGKDKIEK
ncbi:hypothetical protein [Eubacterium sp. 1001713B170207_170306_E7]|uniref:hypothetical protein n=1 Tax=Eubacterium sp. 1001713B170207_170306_E7 TaxID=2787097 RepID=UPI00189C4201|nr:hypothetical protein [Eubacterium sp. 1001713B170207_170306_E7]